MSELVEDLLGVGLASHDPHLENVMYRKVMNNRLIISHMYTFIPAYCKELRVQPLLSCGHVVVNKQKDLFEGGRIFTILLSSFRYRDRDKTIKELRVTAWHELMHVFLYVVGYPIHNEDKIENVAHHLAKCRPQILDVMEEFFPGVNFNSLPEEGTHRYLLKA